MPTLPDIPGFILSEVLGAGASGTVYAAVPDSGPDAGQSMAIKVVSSWPEDPASRGLRALQEARFCFDLDHPHVVRVYDWGQLVDRSTWILMERLRGETLGQRISRGDLMTPAQALQMGRQLARALAVIHGRGALHRDIKPDNLFLCSDGPTPDHLKVLDFGVAGLAAADPARMLKTGRGLLFGTPGFMAPEQATGEAMSPAADVFAAGAALYYALTGLPVVKGPNLQAVLMMTAAYRQPPTLPVGLNAPFLRVLSQCLLPEPEQRPADGAALLEAMEAVEQPPSAAFRKTTLHVEGRALQVGDLHLPHLGDASDHSRFRQHVIMMITRVFRPGHLPAHISKCLTEVDQLQDDRRALQVRVNAAREAADQEACDLMGQAGRLDHAQEVVAVALTTAREKAVIAAAALVQTGDKLRALDRAYVADYRAAERLQAQEAEEATARGEPVSLGGLYGEQVSSLLDALRQRQRDRRALVERQRRLRADQAEAFDAVADLRAQTLELERSALGVEVARQTRLAGLEANARGLEDELIHLDRLLEHTFLELGVALQRTLAVS